MARGNLKTMLACRRSIWTHKLPPGTSLTVEIAPGVHLSFVIESDCWEESAQ
jgi:hypothetical protein